MKQHIGSHNNHARPDAKMAKQNRCKGSTSPQNKTMKRVAAKKRRQRD